MKKEMTNQEEAGIECLILTIRGQKVILDSELAKRYGVSTKRLNEQVKRNADRFPEDFLFQLSPQENEDLRSQFATSNVNTLQCIMDMIDQPELPGPPRKTIGFHVKERQAKYIEGQSFPKKKQEKEGVKGRIS